MRGGVTRVADNPSGLRWCQEQQGALVLWLLPATKSFLSVLGIAGPSTRCQGGRGIGVGGGGAPPHSALAGLAEPRACPGLLP